MKQHRTLNQTSVVIFFIIMLVSTACGTSNEPEVEFLPTVASLPSPTVEGTPVPLPATLPPTWTPTLTETTTPSPTLTETLTVTPSLTITDTPTVTLTFTPPPTEVPRPVTNLIELALRATILPSDYVIPQRSGIEVTLPPPSAEPGDTGDATFGDDSVVVLTPVVQNVQVGVNCTYYPVGGFATAFASDQAMAQQLGCPTGNPPTTLSQQSAYQVFERGFMMWLGGAPSRIYAMYSNGTYQQFPDTFDEALDPASTGLTAPAGSREPTRGFGKVWRTYGTVKDTIGWAISDEFAGVATIQLYAGGQMVYIPTRGDILVLIANPDGTSGTWRSLTGQF